MKAISATTRTTNWLILPVGIVIVVSLLAGVVVANLSPLFSLVLVILTAFLPLLMLAIRSLGLLELFVLMLVAFAPLTEIYGDFNPGGKLGAWKDIIVVLILVIWLARGMVSKQKLLPDNGLTLLVLPFVAISLLSAFITVQLGTLGQALLGLKAVVLYSGLYFVLGTYLDEEKRLIRLLYALVFAVAGITLYAFFKFAFSSIYPTFDRAGRPIGVNPVTRLHYSGSPYFLAQTVGILIALAFFVSNRKLKWGLIALSASAVLPPLMGIVRGPMLAVTAAVAFVLAHAGKHRPRQVLIVCLAIGIAIFFFLQKNPELARQLGTRLQAALDPSDRSTYGRIEEITGFWIPLLESYPFGLGVGALSSVVSGPHWADVFGGVSFFAGRKYAHTTFFLLAGEVGIPGAVIFMLLSGGVVLIGWRLFRRNSARPWHRWLGLGISAQAIAFTVMGFFNPSVIQFPMNLYFWIWAGVLVATRSQADRSAREVGSGS